MVRPMGDNGLSESQNALFPPTRHFPLISDQGLTLSVTFILTNPFKCYLSLSKWWCVFCLFTLKLSFIQKLTHYSLIYIYIQYFYLFTSFNLQIVTKFYLCISMGHTFSPSVILRNFKGVNFALLENKLFLPGCHVSN